MANRISILKSEAVGALPAASAMASGELAVNYADKKIYGKHPGSGAVVQVAASPIHSHQIADISGLQDALDSASGGTINDLDEMFNSARATYYHEVLYNGSGDVSAIEVYTDSGKATHLYSRSFTYDGSGNITTITTTDQQNAGVSLTKTISYNGSGDITNVTRNYVL